MSWIDEYVVGTIEYYGTNNPIEILDSMGIDIVKVDKNSPILAGKHAIYVMDFSCIYMRDDLIHKHELFYLSHEIGHIVLHYEKGEDYISVRIPNDGQQEKQANYFAFSLVNVAFDELQLYQMTIEQIACTLELPEIPLKQLVNM